MSDRDTGIAVALEAIPGFFFQVFGLGHLYQGKVGMGLFIMLSYWALQAINVALMFILIGFVTAPLTFLFYMIASPLNVVGDSSPSSRRLLTA